MSDKELDKCRVAFHEWFTTFKHQEYKRFMWVAWYSAWDAALNNKGAANG